MKADHENSPGDAELLDRYVATFPLFGDLVGYDAPEALRIGQDEVGWYEWRPLQHPTPASALEGFYRGLDITGRLPPLYEALILSYRWSEVDLGSYRLLANDPAQDLSPLLASICADKFLRSTLHSNGYVQFGKGPDVNYDPVCFDLRRRRGDGDCGIIQLDHEAILCDNRIQIKAELASGFRSLVEATIARAEAIRTS